MTVAAVRRCAIPWRVSLFDALSEVRAFAEARALTVLPGQRARYRQSAGTSLHLHMASHRHAQNVCDVMPLMAADAFASQ